MVGGSAASEDEVYFMIPRRIDDSRHGSGVCFKGRYTASRDMRTCRRRSGTMQWNFGLVTGHVDSHGYDLKMHAPRTLENSGRKTKFV